MVLLYLACVLLLGLTPWCINRWRFRHIPGPFAPPVLGNMIAISRMDLIAFIDHCRHKYGTIFKIYIGSNMIICVADAAAAKRMLARVNFRHAGIQLTTGKGDWDFLVDGMVGANGSTWRSLRAAWQPAFSPAALASYMPATNAACNTLLQRLAPAAASGEVVELSKELTTLTLDFVGNAAYGVDLHELEQQQQQQQRQGVNSSSSSSGSQQGLLLRMQAVFDGGGVSNSSTYMAPVLLFPALMRLWQWLAFHWPDKTLRDLSKERQHIKKVSLHLLHSWRPAAANKDTTCSSSSSNSKASSEQHSHSADQRQKQQPTGAAAAADSSPGVKHGGPLLGIQPGTFPKTLLESRDKDTGQPFTDEQIVTQLNSFLLAAFESTAAAICFSIYFIAQHPAVEARLVQEVSAQQHSTQVDLGRLQYTEAVVKEALRLLAPGAIATRITQEQGLPLTPEVSLPPQTAMFACIYSMHRDPDYWPHALDFRPERWLPEGAALQPTTPDAYLPFGGGVRLCVGRPFANQAVITTVARLYQQYSIELEAGQVPLQVKQTFALVPARGMRVRLHKR